MQQNTKGSAIHASHKKAKHTDEEGYGGLVLERKVRNTYYSMPAVLRLKSKNWLNVTKLYQCKLSIKEIYKHK